MPPEHVSAFAPGRVNLIGEHTDYNQGLALPFAIAAGVTVRATASRDPSVLVHALDLGEEDQFPLEEPPPAKGWRAFPRGVVAELIRAGHPLVGAQLQIEGGLAQGAGLSSSSALEVALALALLGLIGAAHTVARIDLAQVCARVESRWVGAQTGLLDQLASLYGASDTALRIDFRTLQIEPVPLLLDGWRLVTLDSGERHSHAGSDQPRADADIGDVHAGSPYVHAGSPYNIRRAESARAAALLGIPSLREARPQDLKRLPPPLADRARHVLDENHRVEAVVAALRARDLPAVGPLLNASHASLRDLYQVSTAAVERAVQELLGAGAAGARIVGGGFGGHVLGLLPPGVHPPPGARPVQAGPGAHLIDP